MKKNYQKPAVNMVVLQYKHQLMQSSIENVNSNANLRYGGGGSGPARSRSGGGDWDDDWDE